MCVKKSLPVRLTCARSSNDVTIFLEPIKDLYSGITPFDWLVFFALGVNAFSSTAARLNTWQAGKHGKQ